MNWKDKFVSVIDETLNKDGDGAYHAIITGEDSFEIFRYDEKILWTEFAEFQLAPHWRMAARNAVHKVIDDNFDRELKEIEK